jgi:4-amino-4-deoxy-L-arabinose transferase-like glycosyltransferase
VFHNTEVINKDGILYINQAKAILNGNWELAKNCGYEFISLYHLLIPVFYNVFGDWIISAKSVSLLFGTLSIIPFYLVVRQFFSNSIAILTTFAFAINPFFVSNSVELIRDPIFWFFSLLGIYFFVSVFNSKDKDYFLLFSSISFLIAGFARFEILVYLIGSFIYIFFSNERKAKRLFLFSLPVAVACVIILSGILVYQKNLNLWDLYLEPRIGKFFYGLKDSLFSTGILQKSIEALKLLLKNLIKLSYLPFLPILIAGFWNLKKEFDRNKNFGYFILLSSLSFLALYLLYIKTEVLSSRYVALVMLPAFVFIGTGIKIIIDKLKTKGFKEKNIIGAIGIYILILGIIPSLDAKREDKLIYKQIGEYVKGIENMKKTLIMSADPRIMFYANLYSKEIECKSLSNYQYIQNLKYSEMVSKLRDDGIRYFVWDERSWATAQYDFLAAAKTEHFTEINRWNHKRGKFVLFYVHK